MTDRIKDLEEDIAELKQLTLTAQRPNIQNHLAQLLSKLKTELDQLNLLKEAENPQKQVPPPLQKTTPTINYTPLTKYAWDQEGNKVKIYFTLEGVGKECSADDVDVIFEKEAVTVRLRGYRKQNLIFAIKKLFAQIVPSDSKYLLKTNTLSITLIKKNTKSWSQLAYKEDSLGKTEKEEAKPEDPNAGLMNMMKKMYEEGDDNMKRTIAEAWTKANDKKGQPDFSDRYDFLKK